MHSSLTTCYSLARCENRHANVQTQSVRNLQQFLYNLYAIQCNTIAHEIAWHLVCMKLIMHGVSYGRTLRQYCQDNFVWQALLQQLLSHNCQRLWQLNARNHMPKLYQTTRSPQINLSNMLNSNLKQ